MTSFEQDGEVSHASLLRPRNPSRLPNTRGNLLLAVVLVLRDVHVRESIRTQA
jgi:hypothetical protein